MAPSEAKKSASQMFVEEVGHAAFRDRNSVAINRGYVQILGNYEKIRSNIWLYIGEAAEKLGVNGCELSFNLNTRVDYVQRDGIASVICEIRNYRRVRDEK